MSSTEHKKTPRATKVFNSLDVAWAAGFLEGEGSFVTNGRRGCTTTASQINQEPLLRLQEIFGGAVVPHKTPKGKPNYRWRTHGMRAAAIARLIFPHLSEKRKSQAERIISRLPRVKVDFRLRLWNIILPSKSQLSKTYFSQQKSVAYIRKKFHISHETLHHLFDLYGFSVKERNNWKGRGKNK